MWPAATRAKTNLKWMREGTSGAPRLAVKKFGLVTIRHNDVVDELGSLCASAITPSAVTHKPLINYGGKRTVTGATAE